MDQGSGVGAWLFIASYLWFQSPPGAEQQFGLLPPITVHSVAFGSVPIQATVHLSQPIEDGMLQPIKVLTPYANGISQGAYIPGLGKNTAPDGDAGGALPPIVEGKLDVRLSNVTVDGVPLRVGDRCSATAQLDFNPNVGEYYFGDPVQGEPGEFKPGYLGKSYMPGNADISAFSNCGVGEDLDPLLTSSISSAMNHIEETLMGGYSLWCFPNIWLSQRAGHLVTVGNVGCQMNFSPPIGSSPMPAAQSRTLSHSMSLRLTTDNDKEATNAEDEALRKFVPQHVRKQLTTLRRQLSERYGPQDSPE